MDRSKRHTKNNKTTNKNKHHKYQTQENNTCVNARVIKNSSDTILPNQANDLSSKKTCQLLIIFNSYTKHWAVGDFPAAFF